MSSNKPSILVVMGVSGSGKSTVGKALAAVLGWSFIEGDRFHPKANIKKMESGIPLTDEDRAGWLAALRLQIEACIRGGNHAVVACSALKETYREDLKVGDAVQFVFLNAPFDVVAIRLQNRKGHFMPASLLESQFDALEEPDNQNSINVDAQHSVDQIVEQVVAKLQN